MSSQDNPSKLFIDLSSSDLYFVISVAQSGGSFTSSSSSPATQPRRGIKILTLHSHQPADPCPRHLLLLLLAALFFLCHDAVPTIISTLSLSGAARLIDAKKILKCNLLFPILADLQNRRGEEMHFNLSNDISCRLSLSS